MILFKLLMFGTGSLIQVVGTARDYKILWVDDDPLILSSAQRLLRHSPFHVVTTQSALEAQALLTSQTFALLVVDQRMPVMTGIDLLEYARKHAESTSRFLLTGFAGDDVIREAVNRGGVFRFISKPWEDALLLESLNEGLLQHQLVMARQQLMHEAKDQNRKLAQLTGNLEQIVEERTRSIENSKIEAEKTSAQIRDLVRFASQLSSLTSLEDLLILIRKELRRFHQVGVPLLASLDEDNKPFVLTFQASQVVRKHPDDLWPNSYQLRVNDKEDQLYLANIVGRPFHRVIAVPLRRGGDVRDQRRPPTIFLEHAFSDVGLDEFLTFWAERLESLSVALDRLLLEGQMRAASLQWESTFDGIRDPIAIVDVDYHVVRSNRSFGVGPGRLSCHQMFAQDERICHGCPAAATVLANEPRTGQIRRGHRLYSVDSFPIKIRGDLTSTNLINHYVDITDSRALYGRMIQNEKMAAIGLLAGNIAHELNNPLTGIRSLAQILMHEVEEGTLKSDLNEVEKAAQRCETIIRNLLEFSQGSPQKVTVIPLNEIVMRTLPMLKTAMRSHASEVNLADEVLNVRVEPHLLQQVVFNLVNNACQAMKDPGTITIETLRVSNSAKIIVRDTGMGIAPENLAHIFQPFFTTKSEGQGTGLGLSVSRSIVEQFGGHIEVNSETGAGSEFTIWLPLVEAS